MTFQRVTSEVVRPEIWTRMSIDCPEPTWYSPVPLQPEIGIMVIEEVEVAPAPALGEIEKFPTLEVAGVGEAIAPVILQAPDDIVTVKPVTARALYED